MRSIRFFDFGEPAEVMRLDELPTPVPRPGQALVRMRSRPVHASDLHIMRGRYGVLPSLPASPGLEGVGVIEALGEGSDGGLSVGQRVILYNVWGTWQEYLLVDAGRLIPVPGSLSDATAAQLVVNPLSAWVMVTRELDVRPGEWLLQTAAGSTVGRIVLQIARLVGFRTINVVRRREQVDELKAIGADEVVCSTDEDLAGRVAEITGGEGVLKAMDCVAGQVGADALASLAPGGVMLQYGALSTHRQSGAGRLVTPVLSPRLIYGTATFRGWWLYRWFPETPVEDGMNALREVVEHATGGGISIRDGTEYAFEDAAEAARLAEAEARGGKPLLVS